MPLSSQVLASLSLPCLSPGTLHTPGGQGQALPETAIDFIWGSWSSPSPAWETRQDPACFFLAEPSSVQPHLSLARQAGGWSNSRSCPVRGLLFRSPASGSMPHPVTSTCQFPVRSQITSHRNCGLWGEAGGLDRNQGGKGTSLRLHQLPQYRHSQIVLPFKSTKASTLEVHTQHTPPLKNKHDRSHITKTTAICRNTYMQTHT